MAQPVERDFDVARETGCLIVKALPRSFGAVNKDGGLLIRTGDADDIIEVLHDDGRPVPFRPERRLQTVPAGWYRVSAQSRKDPVFRESNLVEVKSHEISAVYLLPRDFRDRPATFRATWCEPTSSPPPGVSLTIQPGAGRFMNQTVDNDAERTLKYRTVVTPFEVGRRLRAEVRIDFPNPMRSMSLKWRQGRSPRGILSYRYFVDSVEDASLGPESFSGDHGTIDVGRDRPFHSFVLRAEFEIAETPTTHADVEFLVGYFDHPPNRMFEPALAVIATAD